jgi:hypothetical protein
LVERLDPGLLDDEPLLRVYFDAAKEHLAEDRIQ